MRMAIAAFMNYLLACAGLLLFLTPAWKSNVLAFTYPPLIASPSSFTSPPLPSTPSPPPPLLPALASPPPPPPNEDVDRPPLVKDNTPTSPASSQPAIPPPSPPPSTPPTPPVSYSSIWDFLVKNNSFPTISLALSTANEVATFNDSSQEVTFFLPTETAFDKLSDALGVARSNRAGLLPYLPVIKRALSYHVLPTRISLQSVANQSVGGTEYYNTTLTMGQSSSIGVRVSPPSSPPATSPEIFILGVSSTAKVLQADVAAGASCINVVDTVLQYWYNSVDEVFASISGASTMYQALKTAQLLKPANVTSPYTIFVPTDEAFVSAFGASAATTILANLRSYESLLRHHVAYGWVVTDTTSEEYVRTSYITLNSNNVTVVVPSNDKADAGVKPTVASAAVPGSPVFSILNTFQVGIEPQVIVQVINGGQPQCSLLAFSWGEVVPPNR
ncbi:cell adhesion molecule, algal-CAM, splicing variant 3 [Volvox carteri f. nagariensis]|uniref:Cell adhesion molecule, algal-CAM, splicing variant 3 n=1 Tax=Volvox carteri f. nagariensis TaxID=3068 RepID=D8UI57_VOLCA|nr:cell adhesion molecule, algal-CAM, splicing variant 3 [Volvox carteri f. nagariensis]EFJ40586.1 cell adhesion molecule, algal-CAM, splicing variant 3 [Volvox carteri f. nagariensis]|eukprot:XP_002958364.1 cell adhesion molecule, algal-CAM, splicing variant 3 [Volvox carteri f. nagariensis]